MTIKRSKANCLKKILSVIILQKKLIPWPTVSMFQSHSLLSFLCTLQMFPPEKVECGIIVLILYLLIPIP